METVGSTISSFATIVRVIIFPGTASSSPLLLFEAMDAVVIVGIVLSILTALSPPVREFTAAPLFPAKSVKVMLNAAVPSVCPPVTDFVADQLLAVAPCVTVTSAVDPSIETVGLLIFSSETMVKVS